MISDEVTRFVKKIPGIHPAKTKEARYSGLLLIYRNLLFCYVHHFFNCFHNSFGVWQILLY